MKNILRLSLGLVLGAIAGTAALAVNHEPIPMVNCQYGQCQAIAKSTGEQCKHCVSHPGDLYCWEHSR
jgi:hypothetical protein